MEAAGHLQSGLCMPVLPIRASSLPRRLSLRGREGVQCAWRLQQGSSYPVMRDVRRPRRGGDKSQSAGAPTLQSAM